ncbi:NAD kinase [Gammaproteobacteria bacterium 42_54_T18]|nr:NAD kinase [Gammaproteobacteria bacterium 42_54_T18]
MQAKEQFRTIGLIGRMGSELVGESLHQLIELLDKHGLSIVIEENTATILPGDNHQKGSRKMMGEICDLIIVVGGDGCLLGAARDFARSRVSLLGINRGRLGFLTDISPQNINTLVTEVLNGQYLLEERFLLEAEVVRDGRPIGESSALNDVVFHSGSSITMLEFELFIEGQFVYCQRSDGIIISTPTGSTAYALSGGGPIMHPNLDAIVLVPMFPHTLSSRPLVVGGNSEIKIVVSKNNECSPRLTSDGQGDISVEPGDVLYVRKKSHKMKLLHPLNHSFYESCRSKLGWSEVL